MFAATLVTSSGNSLCLGRGRKVQNSELSASSAFVACAHFSFLSCHCPKNPILSLSCSKMFVEESVWGSVPAGHVHILYKYSGLGLLKKEMGQQLFGISIHRWEIMI